VPTRTVTFHLHALTRRKRADEVDVDFVYVMETPVANQVTLFSDYFGSHRGWQIVGVDT
jgi:hypothetical protein